VVAVRHTIMPRIVLPGMDSTSSFTTSLPATSPDGASLSGAADAFLWAVQGVLALALVVLTVVSSVLIRAGRFDAFLIPAVAALSVRTFTLIGISHVLGGLGLVLPQLTGVLPWLTPLAGLALGVQAFMAAGFHLRAGEEALEPALWGVLYLVVAVGRIDLLGIASPIPDPALVVTICVLLVALAVNLVVLLRGERNPFRVLSEGPAPDAARPASPR